MIDFYHTATVFAVLASPVRLRIIEKLKVQPRYPSELAKLLNVEISQSSLSKELKKLCEADIIAYKEEGYTVQCPSLKIGHFAQRSRLYFLKESTTAQIAAELRECAEEIMPGIA